MLRRSRLHRRRLLLEDLEVRRVMASQVTNLLPSAEAGGPYSVSEGGAINLSGSGSDAAGEVTFAWDLDGDGVFGEVGEDALRGNETGASPTFNAVAVNVSDGPLTVTLRVTDDEGTTATDTATIEVTNVLPTATITFNTNAPEGGEAIITASASEAVGTVSRVWDLDGDGIFEYTGSTAFFSAFGRDGFVGNTATVWMKAIDDEGTESAVQEVTFDIVNVPPLPHISGPYNVSEGGSRILSGSALDPGGDADPLIFLWDLDGDGIFGESGPDAERGEETGLNVAFIATGLDGRDGATYEVKLIAVDDEGEGGETSVELTIENAAPVPNLGGPYNVNEDSLLLLTGSVVDGGGPADPFTFAWDLDNDGVFGETGSAAQRGAENVLSPQFNSVGLEGPRTWPVTLRAADDEGAANSATVLININDTNDAPLLNIDFNPALPQIAEDVADPAGGLVQALVDSEVTDRDVAALKGIVVTGLSNTSQGTWEYKLNASSEWTPFGSVATTSARALPLGARVRFIPNANYNGQVRMFYRAWDQTQTSSTGTFNLSQPISVGGSTAFSLASEVATLNVLAINDAPLLRTPLQPQLVPIQEGQTDSTGTLVRDLIAGTVIEADANSLQGIAVISAVSGYGRWEYSLNGSNWLPLTAASSSTTRLLPADDTTRVRFVPTNLNYSGTVRLNYRLWDQTQGTAGGEFNLVGPGKLGGRTAFSFNVEIATQVIQPVNDAPTLANLGGPVGYLRNDPARVLSPAAVVSDIDSPFFTGGQLRVRISEGASAGNLLSIGSAFTIAGSNISLNGAHVGTLNANAGQGTTDLVVTFTSSASRGIVQQLVRSVTFATSNVAPIGNRQLHFSLTDNAGASTGELTKIVVVR